MLGAVGSAPHFHVQRGKKIFKNKYIYIYIKIKVSCGRNGTCRGGQRQVVRAAVRAGEARGSGLLVAGGGFCRQKEKA